MREPLLFNAYRETYRVEPCACGGSIAAPHEEWEQIRLAVMEHNDTPVHRGWAKWMGLRQPGERPTVIETPRDVSAVAGRTSAPPPAGGPGSFFVARVDRPA